MSDLPQEIFFRPAETMPMKLLAYARATSGWLMLSACALPVGDVTSDDPLAEAHAFQAEPTVIERAPQGVAVSPLEPPTTFGREVTFTGSGCRTATAKPVVSADGKLVTIYFSEFTASLLPTDLYKMSDCWIGYDIIVPPGYTYAVTQFVYNVNAIVPEGVRATLSASYGFEGEGQPAGDSEQLAPNRLDHPIEAHAVRHVVTQKKWSPCSVKRPLMAKVNISLKNSRPGQSATLDLFMVNARPNREGFEPMPGNPDKSLGAVELTLEWARCPMQQSPASQ